jgi:endonuclease/exonuclease/phosphatase family metal-dependent hydrolase
MSVRFKVLQFNMQFGQSWRDVDPDGAPVDLSATVAEIRSHHADVILLQEVERAQKGGTQPPLPPNYSRLKQELPGYDGYFAFPKEDPRELPFGIGLAIFSRTPLYNHRRRDLPSPAVEFQFDGELMTPTDRLLIGARTVIGGREVNVFNTHLLALFMLRSSSEAHPQQRALVVEEVRRCAGPTLVGGDFNVSRHESLVEQFGAAGFATAQSRDITWRRRPYVLDHVFHNAGLRCVAHEVRPTSASDHHALVAEFEFAD